MYGNFECHSVAEPVESPKFIMYEKKDVDSELAKRDEILSRISVKFTPEYFKTNYNLADGVFSLPTLQT
jgi:hypothetical protein